MTEIPDGIHGMWTLTSTRPPDVTKKASSILGCIKKCGQQVDGGYPSPLLCSGGATLKYSVHFWPPQFIKDKDLIEGDLWRATKVIKGPRASPV